MKRMTCFLKLAIAISSDANAKCQKRTDLDEVVPGLVSTKLADEVTDRAISIDRVPWSGQGGNGKQRNSGSSKIHG